MFNDTSDGKVRNVGVPWARPGSGFTLLFEALAITLIEREMPVNCVAEVLKVNPQRKRRARGGQNINNIINMIYFLCGKLKFDYPLYFT